MLGQPPPLPHDRVSEPESLLTCTPHSPEQEAVRLFGLHIVKRIWRLAIPSGMHALANNMATDLRTFCPCKGMVRHASMLVGLEYDPPPLPHV